MQPTDSVQSLAFADADKKTLVFCLKDGRVLLWRLSPRQEPLEQVHQHIHEAVCVACGADDQATMVASGGAEGSIMFTRVEEISRDPLPPRWLADWLKTAIVPRPIKRETSVIRAASVVKSIAINSERKLLICGDISGSIYVWDIGRPASAPLGREIASEPRGTYVIKTACDAGHEEFAWGCADGGVVLKRPTDAKPIVLNRGAMKESRLTALKFSPRGTFLAAGFADGSWSMWATASPNKPGESYTPSGATAVTCIAFSPSESRVTLATDNGWLIRYRTSKPANDEARAKSPSPIQSLEFRDENTIISGDSGGQINVWQWNANTPTPIGTYGQQPIIAVEWSPSRELIAAAGADNVVRLVRWDGQQADSFIQDAPSRAVAFSGDGRYVAWASDDGVVTVAQFERDNDSKSPVSILARLKGHNSEILSVNFDTDGTSIITADRVGMFIRWSLDSNDWASKLAEEERRMRIPRTEQSSQ